MQTEDSTQYKTIRYLAAWNYYRISMLRIAKHYWTICSTVRLSWLPSELGWLRRRSLAYSASGKSNETSRQTYSFSPSGLKFFQSIAITCDAKMKRLSLGYSSSSLLFSLYRIDFICVLKWLCIETSANLSNPSQTALPYNAMHFGIDTTWQMVDAKERFTFMYNNWSADHRNYSTSWEKLLSNEVFFSSIISESW